MTSKRLRSRQIEKKSLMGRRVSGSLVVASKSAYISYWINKVWIKFPSRRNTQIIIVINKCVEAERVERCSGAKKVARLKENKFDLKMGDICEETVAEVDFFQYYLLQINVLTWIPQLVLFDFDPWKFIIAGGIILTPCAYEFYIFFTSQHFE